MIIQLNALNYAIECQTVSNQMMKINYLLIYTVDRNKKKETKIIHMKLCTKIVNIYCKREKQLEKKLTKKKTTKTKKNKNKKKTIYPF